VSEKREGRGPKGKSWQPLGLTGGRVPRGETDLPSEAICGERKKKTCSFEAERHVHTPAGWLKGLGSAGSNKHGARRGRGECSGLKVSKTALCVLGGGGECRTIDGEKSLRRSPIVAKFVGEGHRSAREGKEKVGGSENLLYAGGRKGCHPEEKPAHRRAGEILEGGQS